MREAANRRSRFTGVATGALLALATFAAAAPASALANGLTVPHSASQPQTITPQAASPAPPPQHLGSTPPPSLPPAPSGGGSTADPEASLPGADIPPQGNDQPYPTDLPGPFSGRCDGDCLQTFHDWYFNRIQTVQQEDPEAADELRQDLEAIDQQIREGGGVPGEGPSTVIDEPGDAGTTTDAGPGAPTIGSSQTSPEVTPVAVASMVVDAITGAGPIVPENVEPEIGEPFDLGARLQNFVGMMTLGGMLLGAPVTMDIIPQVQPQDGTTVCPKQESGEGKVPICQK